MKNVAVYVCPGFAVNSAIYLAASVINQHFWLQLFAGVTLILNLLTIRFNVDYYFMTPYQKCIRNLTKGSAS
jgi:hypothetical protein